MQPPLVCLDAINILNKALVFCKRLDGCKDLGKTYPPFGCPFRYAMSIIGDRWTLLILRDMVFKGFRSFSEFHQAGEGISTNVLADRLALLMSSGMVTKSPDPTNASKLRYQLTSKAHDFIPVLFEIARWSAKYDERSEFPAALLERIQADPDALLKEIVDRSDSAGARRS
ncbi:MAG: helix-turn-helix domain-containing protein [Pseudomonadota bacterium]